MKVVCKVILCYVEVEVVVCVFDDVCFDGKVGFVFFGVYVVLFFMGVVMLCIGFGDSVVDDLVGVFFVKFFFEGVYDWN